MVNKNTEPVSESGNFLHDVAALTFECSIAAAELNKTAHELLEEGKIQKGLYIVDEVGDYPITATVTRLRWNLSLFGQPAETVLLRPRNYEAEHHGPKNWRSWLGSKAVSAKPSNYVLDREPMLAVKTGDIVLPIATFARAAESEDCSYVQLGSEIVGESIFSTTKDEIGSRNDIVESLRSMQSNATNTSSSRQTPSNLLPLMRAELARKEHLVQAALESQVVRAGKNYLAQKLLHPHTYDVIQSDLTTLPASVQMGMLSTIYKTEAGATSQLVVTDSEVDGPQLQVLYRSSLLVPVARLVIGENRLESLQAESLPPKALLKLSSHLNQPRQHSFGVIMYHRQDNFGTYLDPKSVTAVEAGSLGLATLNYRSKARLAARTIASLSQGYKSQLMKEMTESCYQEVCEDIDSDYDPTLTTLKQHLKSNYSYGVKEHNELLTELGLGNGAQFIGEADEPTEFLLNHLAILWRDRSADFTCEYEDVQIGKTTGTLLYKAQVSKQGRNYRLIISGKPAAMEREAFQRLYEAEFDPLQPDKLDPVRVRTLCDILWHMQLGQ